MVPSTEELAENPGYSPVRVQGQLDSDAEEVANAQPGRQKWAIQVWSPPILSSSWDTRPSR